MLGDLWGGATDLLGDTLSSILESILNATIFKLCYYIERMLCWIVGILMDLFNIFSGLETVTYNGSKNFLINIFFANKAINNIFWAMAIIGFILVFVFTGWSVIRKIFDINAKHQESLGQIIWSGIRSIFLIVGLTLVINVVLTGTGILMQQIDFIFNNAYHLDQPQERDFTDEEYAAMGRVLATIGNYSMVPSSNSRYNLNACFNAIRGDMELLQKQGVFDYSYYQPDADGNIGESWQSVLSQIAKSTDLRRDVMIDVYNEGVATSITAAMDYLRNTKDPRPVDHVEASYTVTERANLDRMIFLMGTMRAAKNSAYNENPAFDDALRGPYYYNENRDIYSFSDVNRDFNIGFEMDYVLVWLASVAIIVDLTIVILNCIARIFNMLFLYIIAPPIIAVSPLDNGGKFKQWTTAFLVQSLSVFGTVIAMRLLLIYLPIVSSPQLVLFYKPVLNAIGKFMLVFGGVEAAKKSTGLLTGILADSAGMEAVRSGDMSSTANRMVGAAGGLALGAAGKAAGAAGSVLNFATKPVQNLAGRAWNATGGKLASAWSNLGKGDVAGQKAMDSAKERLATERAYEQLTSGGKGGSPSTGSGSPPRNGPGGPPPANPAPGGGAPANPPPGGDLPGNQQANQPNNQPNNPQNPANEGREDRGRGAPQQPPPLPGWFGRNAADAESTQAAGADRMREQRGFSRPGAGEGQAPRSRDDSTLPSSRNRPTLEGAGRGPERAAPRNPGERRQAPAGGAQNGGAPANGRANPRQQAPGGQGNPPNPNRAAPADRERQANPPQGGVKDIRSAMGSVGEAQPFRDDTELPSSANRPELTSEAAQAQGGGGDGPEAGGMPPQEPPQEAPRQGGEGPRQPMMDVPRPQQGNRQSERNAQQQPPPQPQPPPQQGAGGQKAAQAAPMDQPGGNLPRNGGNRGGNAERRQQAPQPQQQRGRSNSVSPPRQAVPPQSNNNPNPPQQQPRQGGNREPQRQQAPQPPRQSGINPPQREAQPPRENRNQEPRREQAPQGGNDPVPPPQVPPRPAQGGQGRDNGSGSLPNNLGGRGGGEPRQ